MADTFSNFEFSSEIKSARRKLWVASGAVIPLILGISVPSKENVFTILGTHFDGSRLWQIFLIAGALVFYLLLIFVLRLREEWFKVKSVAPLMEEIQQLNAVVQAYNNGEADKKHYNQLIQNMDIPTLIAKLHQEYIFRDGLALLTSYVENVKQLTDRMDLNEDHKNRFTNGIWQHFTEIENEVKNISRKVDETNARLTMIGELLSRTIDYFSMRYPNDYEKMMSKKQKKLKNGAMSIKLRWIVLEAIIPALFGLLVCVACGLRVLSHLLET